VRNYAVVTVTFKNSPDLSVFNRRSDASKDRCAEFTLVASAAIASHQKRYVCPLVRDNTSVRMVLLGEAGVWTLLHGLGEQGAPLFVKTVDIAAISRSPLVLKKAAPPSPVPVQVTLKPPESGPIVLASINERLDAMRSTMSAERFALLGRFERIESIIVRLADTNAKLRICAVPSSIEVGFTPADVAELARLIQGPFAGSDERVLPAKYIGVEQHLSKQCLLSRLLAKIQVERGETRKSMQQPGVLSAVDTLLSGLKSMDPARYKHVDVVLGGTVDSTGATDVNVSYSDRRATFMHHLVERAIEQSLDLEIAALRSKLSMLSYGSGESLPMPGDVTSGGVGAVLVKICDQSIAPTCTGLGKAVKSEMQSDAMSVT